MTTIADQVPGSQSVPVRLRGRVYSPDPSVPVPSERPVQELKETSEDQSDLQQAIGEDVLNLLPWASLPSAEGDRQTLVQTYVESLAKFSELREDVQKMVHAACVTSLEFRQARGDTNIDARDAALTAKLNEMVAQAAWRWTRPANVLNAELVSRDAATLRHALASSIARAVSEFTSELFELLAKLVERQFLGLLEWHPNHCCSYHFFKRVIIQENEGITQRIVTSWFDDLGDLDSSTEDRVVGTRRIETVLHGKHCHRFARHEHHVLNAICTTIGNSQVVMPPQVVSLIEHIPKWLYPHVRVIDGDIFRELIVEQDAGVEDWTKEIDVRDEPIWGVEPAVIIGHFVLTGWGPREVGQEQARRRSVEHVQAKKVVEQTARWQASLFAVAAAILTLVAILLLGQWLRGGGGLVFALLATAAAVGAVWQAVFDFEHARGNPTAALAAHWLTGSIGCQILLGEWFIARWFQPLSWVTPVILGVGVIICHSVGRRLQ